MINATKMFKKWIVQCSNVRIRLMKAVHTKDCQGFIYIILGYILFH